MQLLDIAADKQFEQPRSPWVHHYLCGSHRIYFCDPSCFHIVKRFSEHIHRIRKQLLIHHYHHHRDYFDLRRQSDGRFCSRLFSHVTSHLSHFAITESTRPVHLPRNDSHHGRRVLNEDINICIILCRHWIAITTGQEPTISISLLQNNTSQGPSSSALHIS
jgi:hypothetical protein